MESLQDLLFHGKFSQSVIANGKHVITYQDLRKYVSLLVTAFGKHGMQKQEKIVLISEPSIEWILVDLAAVASGLITVPMFATSSNETLSFQINDCKPEYIIAQDETVLEKISSVTRHVFKGVFLVHGSNKFGDIKTVWNLADEAKHLPQVQFENIDRKSTATIVYTSGTSGAPKGVVLTYNNLASQVLDIQSSFHDLNSTDHALSILPLAHIFQRIIIMFYLSRGISIHIVNNMQKVLPAIQEINPSLMTVVPRVLEKVHARVFAQVESKPAMVRKMFLPILEYSSTRIITNRAVKFLLNLLIFKKVRSVFGKKMRMIVSGGAKLNEREEIFFHNAGLNVLQGYGMTECSPVIASNTNDNRRLFTVGKPFSSVEVKIAENCEICVRGSSVFGGYLNHEVLGPDEFFKTGDIGFLDKDGFLTVTGRLKEQFKNANGKYIDPIKIENLINNIAGVEASCVIAEGRPYTVAVIFTEVAEEQLRIDINEMNKHLDHHEHVQYFHITSEKPTIENNIITQSLKLRRNDVMKKYKKEIDSLYRR